MAETSYPYSLANDFTYHKVAPSRLQQEVIASSISTRIVRIDTAGDEVDIVFDDALSSEDQATLNLVVSGHSGNPLPPDNNVDSKGNPVVATSVYGFVEERTRFKGYRYVAPPNTLSLFDEQIAKQLYLQGGTGTIDNAVDGDYAEFSIVDKDDVLGLFSTYGLTVGRDVLELDKYVKTHYLPNGSSTLEHRVPVAAPVMPGLYFRVTYNAVSGGSDRTIRTTYLWYENPN